MPKRLKPLGPVLSCAPVQQRLVADWKAKWLPSWERKHGPATITQAEAEYLIWGSVEYEVWGQACVGDSDAFIPYPDVPAPGWSAPVGVRHFAAFFSRAPDECLDFLCWARRYGEYVGGSDLLRAEMVAQAVSLRSRLGRVEFSHKEVANAAGVSVETAEKAVKKQRIRFPEKRERKKSG